MYMWAMYMWDALRVSRSRSWLFLTPRGAVELAGHTGVEAAHVVQPAVEGLEIYDVARYQIISRLDGDHHCRLMRRGSEGVIGASV